jgi:hypothetical protein
MRSFQRIAWRPTLCADGKIRYLVLEVDTNDLLDWLGEKAKKSSGKKAVEASGAVRVTLRNKEK